VAGLPSPHNGPPHHQITDGKLEVKLRGLFRSRRIPLADIRSIETIHFDPVRDYGWLRNSFHPGGKAGSLDSTSGVILKLADGQKLVIGTTNPPN